MTRNEQHRSDAARQRQNHPTEDDVLLISIKKTCEWLDCGRTSVYQLLNAREIVAVKCGRNTRIVPQSVRDYVARLISASRQSDGGRK